MSIRTNVLRVGGFCVGGSADLHVIQNVFSIVLGVEGAS
jgi:hypothetical protein